MSKKLGKYYRDLDAFKSGFQQLHRDKGVDTLVYKTLRPLRNEAVFHSDPGAVAENLKMMNDPEYVFVRAEGRGAGYTYFDLADATALRVVFGSRADAEYIERARGLIQAVTQAAIRFLSASDALISSVLDTPDWQLTVPPTTWRSTVRQGGRKIRRWLSTLLPILRQRA